MEKPILFSAPMVRDILAGKKTETRRVVNLQPSEKWNDIDIRCHFYNPTIIDKNGEEQPGDEIFGFADEEEGWECPYGAVGDHLWVRETFRLVDSRSGNNDFGVQYLADNKILWWRDNGNEMNYPIDERKRPSIFMFRKFSRITLEIVGIRVERLQEIDKDGGAWFEGFQTPCPLAAFMSFWNKIHRRDGWTWDKNPYVWVIQFKTTISSGT